MSVDREVIGYVDYKTLLIVCLECATEHQRYNWVPIFRMGPGLVEDDDYGFYTCSNCLNSFK